jgi:hypothetical protein
MLSRNTSLDEVMRIAGSYSCKRGFGCCKFTPMLTEEDLNLLKEFFRKKGVAEERFVTKYIEQGFFYGFLSAPTFKKENGVCIFIEVQESDGRIRKKFASTCRDGLKKSQVTYCNIQDSKPLACKIMHCGSDAYNSHLWFAWNYFIKGNPKLEAEFEKRNRNKYVWI